MFARLIKIAALLVVANTAAAPLVATAASVVALVVAGTVIVECLDTITATNRAVAKTRR